MLRKCPIENALDYIGKKWSLEIVRDLFMGKHQFKEFLEANPDLSNKMLSQRLKELESNGIVDKKIAGVHPVRIEYWLTKKGKSLNGILYELGLFSIKECSDDVCKKGCNREDAKKVLEKMFGRN